MLNIKNPETHRLARELARRRGESLTAAVTRALREQLKREAAESPTASVADILALAEALDLQPAATGEDPVAFLYDETTGLPA